MDQLLELLSSPLGAGGAGAVLMLALQKLVPAWAWPLVQALFKKGAPASPAVAELALKAVRQAAKRRFPNLTEAEAFERWLVGEANLHYYALDAAAEKPKA